jgi:TorA maturation chaperone TorD
LNEPAPGIDVSGEVDGLGAEVDDRIAAEDLARARWYGFFARWLLSAPDKHTVHAVLSAGGPDDPGSGELASAWRAFRDAVAASTPEALRSAYDDTFVSTGSAPVSLHASVYLSGFANEWPLVEARRWLAGLGIEPSASGLLTEDHLGLLCEVMAWLIVERDAQQAQDGGPKHGGADEGGRQAPQHYLFRRFIGPVFEDFARQLADAPDAGAYRELGRVFESFMAIERLAFEIDE